MAFKNKLVITAICAGLLSVGAARAQFLSDRDGRPISTKQYTDVEGNPYLSNDWANGSVKLANGKVYNDLELKYDLKEDAVYFKDKNTGEAMAFVVPADEFTLTYVDSDDSKIHIRRYKRGYKDIGKTTPQSYFEVLSEGRVTVLKRLTKDIITTQEFNSAVQTRTFKENNHSYYLLKDGKALQVKNDRKSILALLEDKKPELDAYLKSTKVDFKSDAELGNFITFYNSL